MAEIEVQPKEKSSSSFLPWFLLALGVIALVYFLTRNGNRNEAAQSATVTDTTTFSSTSENAARADWGLVDYENAPDANFNEMRSDKVDVRGNEQYAIYSMDEDHLFQDEEASIKADAQETLKEVTESINTRFSNGEVRIFSSAENNSKAEALRAWLNQNGLMNSNVSVHSNSERNTANNLLNNNDDKLDIVVVRAD